MSSRAAAANVYVNLPAIGDDGTSRELLVRTEELADQIERHAEMLKEAVRSGESREPIEVRPE